MYLSHMAYCILPSYLRLINNEFYSIDRFMVSNKRKPCAYAGMF
jgi:hypothetical protein